ncbi:hypothetical protein G6O69_02815 [Pseudenhygromyxa sp. WMMC2535]|uniref:KAP family P-loop NTPase fold protein n=1 Tax=Pseudenhygromyxa sp. WMMC2535 TaxID=2712867 RepID=UPI00155239A1|nr:P-loop NTPase fold protein [Pseudenhygromyxa sp. WMMC2535]NVB36748.1 hypothetical protein [Pseudenhygromyxa sp. WMMC2535]
MSEVRELSTTGFPDLPIDPLRAEGDDNRDLLGLEQHAAALSGFIQMCSMPMTIGIQGDWGSGKTSLMNLVRAKLGNEHALNIWFNTWQYSQFGNEAQLASSMLVNLMQKIKAEGKPTKKVWHNASRFIRSVVQASALTSGMAAGISIQGKSFLDALEGRGDLDDAGLFEQMKADFSEVIQDVLAQGGEGSGFQRVVIYIDDLDRLAPSKAVELLEAVKNLIDVDGCVFVLAIDYDVVIRGLRQRKEYIAEDFREAEGKSFFDKIIQVPYRMPVERYTTHTFLQSHFERVYGELGEQTSAFFEASASRLIQASVGNNPRGLKRALNIHSLFSHLMRLSSEEEVGEGERLVTLVFACVQVALPQMYALLSKHQSPFWTLVALREPSLHGLLEAPEGAPGFAEVAGRINETLHRLREPTEDDDDDTTDDDAASVEALVTDLRRFVLAKETGKQKRIRELAGIALDAINVNGDEVYSQAELEVLDSALSVTSTTSVKAEDDEEVETAPRVRRNVGFRELSELLPEIFVDRPMLVFWDPETSEYNENFKRIPDYESSVSRLRVVVDGASVSLKEETLRVLALQEERGGRAQTASEQAGRVNSSNYWVIEGDEEERTVTAVREAWKRLNIGNANVDMRSSDGREAFERRILAYMRNQDGYIPARQVQENVGGSMAQLRRALNRLIEQGLVTYKGRARGTRYAACN